MKLRAGAEKTHVDRALIALLHAVAHAPLLSRDYVVKGGLALRLGYGSPRRSDDLDLSSARPFSADVTDEKNEMLLGFCEVLDDALLTIAPRYGLADMRTAERTLSDEIPALLGSVTYRDGDNGAAVEVHVVKLQVTLSEFVCETVRRDIGGFSILTAALEDILAEKLKAILQQQTRNKLRPMDVYDIWYFTTKSPVGFDLSRVREYLEVKAARWPEIHPPTLQRFRTSDLREHSEGGWGPFVTDLAAGAPDASFDDAWAAVVSLVERLELREV